MVSFATPNSGASLLLSFKPTNRKVLIIGTGRLATSRVLAVLEAGGIPVVVSTKPPPQEDCTNENNGFTGVDNAELRWRMEMGQCHYVSFPLMEDGRRDQNDIAFDTPASHLPDLHERRWGDLIDKIDGHDRSIFAVCITDTLNASDTAALDSKISAADTVQSIETARMILRQCRMRRIPVNVADQPHLCDFSFPATHRFPLQAGSATDRNDKSSNDDNSTSSGLDQPNHQASPLQIAVTTNGQGCRLAGRIRREIISMLPSNIGDAVERIGQMRNLAKSDASLAASPSLKRNQGNGDREAHADEGFIEKAASTRDNNNAVAGEEEDDQSYYSTPLNSPVPAVSAENMKTYFDNPQILLRHAQARHILEEERKRRMRWVAQMSEYWPIGYIGSMSQTDMKQALDLYKDVSRREKVTTSSYESLDQGLTSSTPSVDSASRGRLRQSASNLTDGSSSAEGSKRTPSQHNLELRLPPRRSKKGEIVLVGSGPGHPGLLTASAYRLLTSEETDLVLSDKLVPSSILALVPSSTTLHIARKFPGNAEGAQSELIALAIQAAGQGKRVIRLKQGDSYIYGRGGEEVLAFRRHGFSVSVVPGISSAMAAPLLVGIPVTQRGSADSLVLCTGVGRGGKQVGLPGYERGRSLIILMGVARIKEVIKTLSYGWKSAIDVHQCEEEENSARERAGHRSGAPYPPYLPIAVIERASSSDQRSITTTLDKIEESIQDCGEQRPPGMMVVGWSVIALEGGMEGNVDILDEGEEFESDCQELERRDRHRVDLWLSGRSYHVRQGLDEFYRREYANLSASQLPQHFQDIPADDEVSEKKQEWAEPRYGQGGIPRGGWTVGEQVSNTTNHNDI